MFGLSAVCKAISWHKHSISSQQLELQIYTWSSPPVPPSNWVPHPLLAGLPLSAEQTGSRPARCQL